VSAVPRVIAVTGAYAPEIGAAGIQCRAVAAALQGRAVFSVITTAVDPTLPLVQDIDGVTVYRVPVDVTRRASKALASIRLVVRLLRARSSYDLVHLHGISQKNIAVTVAARAMAAPLVLTLHTAGQDEPDAASGRGRLAARSLAAARLVIGVSPYMTARYAQSGLPAGRYRMIPNGVDVNRFHPADAVERSGLRRRLGWPDQPAILFVGFFSRDKRPDGLFRAWQQLADRGLRTTLVYVGSTASPYYEIDHALERDLRAAAASAGRADDLRFTGPVNDVETYLRAADVFALPSIRETQSMALIEAMACGLPSVASRLEGATDAFVVDGVNGRLVPPGDDDAMATALRELLSDDRAAAAIGVRARRTIVERYAIETIAEQWLAAYRDVLRGPST
jgi:glycosyltransferase involved in cell wall biosynthesis